MATVRAVVFDAYGTLLDFATASERAGDVLGERWRAFSDLWRRKQLEYTWLRSLMRRHVDFWQVTGESLDYALQAFAIGRRRCHAVGVRGRAIADDFGERRRAARQRMIQRLDHQNGGALAHDEAVALRVERPRGARRFVVEMSR